jgi:hypothetical protein
MVRRRAEVWVSRVIGRSAGGTQLLPGTQAFRRRLLNVGLRKLIVNFAGVFVRRSSLGANGSWNSVEIRTLRGAAKRVNRVRPMMPADAGFKCRQNRLTLEFGLFALLRVFR